MTEVTTKNKVKIKSIVMMLAIIAGVIWIGFTSTSLLSTGSDDSKITDISTDGTTDTSSDGSDSSKNSGSDSPSDSDDGTGDGSGDSTDIGGDDPCDQDAADDPKSDECGGGDIFSGDSSGDDGSDNSKIGDSEEPPCPEGTSSCGDEPVACCSADESCYIPVGGEGQGICRQKEGTCKDPNPKECPGTIKTCCPADNSCGINRIKRPPPGDAFDEDIKIATCVPPDQGGCKSRAPGYCGKIDGKPLCCTGETHCVSQEVGGTTVSGCFPNEDGCGGVLCRGTGDFSEVTKCCSDKGCYPPQPNGLPGACK